MSKLKDYKDKIKGFPGKKRKLDVTGPEDINDYVRHKERVIGYNQAHEIFSNLEFNPAELLDKKKIEVEIYSWIVLGFTKLLGKNKIDAVEANKGILVICEDIAQAIVDSRDIVKAKGDK